MAARRIWDATRFMRWPASWICWKPTMPRSCAAAGIRCWAARPSASAPSAAARRPTSCLTAARSCRPPHVAGRNGSRRSARNQRVPAPKRNLRVTLQQREAGAVSAAGNRSGAAAGRAVPAERRPAQPAGVHYFCDASVLADGGIPSVVFGPGDIAQAHTADEWISLASLERGKELLRRS